MIALNPVVAAGALRNVLGDRRYGRVKWVANHFGLSRPTLYRLEANFLQTVCRGPGRRNKSPQQKEIERLQVRVAALEQQNARLQTQVQQQVGHYAQAVARTRFWLIGLGLPARAISRLLRLCFGVRANRTAILRQTRQYAARATQIMQAYFWPAAQDVDVDEIFIENLPLFVASDPHSLAILNTSMEKECTVLAWSAFLRQMPNLRRTTSDRGQSIMGAVNRRKDLVCQSDIFHPKRLLRDELAVLENHCYGLIALEDRLKNTLEKTDLRGRDCRAPALRLRKASEQTREAIDRFDALESAVHLAFDALRITTTQGTFNSAVNAREQLQFAKAWIHAHLPEGWNKVKRALEDNAMLTFLTELQRALPTLAVVSPTAQDRQYVLVTLARLWEDQAAQRWRGKSVRIPQPIQDELHRRCANCSISLRKGFQ